MRAFEFNDLYGLNYLNTLIEAKRKTLGLLCSFQNAPLGSSKINYVFENLKKTVEEICTELNVDFNLVGANQDSLDWMDEVYKVVLGSHLIIVDVSDPRPNVLYELGVACSLRPSDSVIITKHKASEFESTEIEQLQILTYDCFHDLKALLLEHFNARSWPVEQELNKAFSTLHNKLDPAAMLLLYDLKEYHDERRGTNEENMWHMSFKDIADCIKAKELKDNGLVKFEYGKAKKKGSLEYALHATELGKKYLESDYFKRFFYPESKHNHEQQ